MQKCQRRLISQHLTIHSTNSKSPINFHVDLLKVPSNFGYYSGRVNRPYNEDRWQASVLNLRPESLRCCEAPKEIVKKEGDQPEKEKVLDGFSGYDFDNVKLLEQTSRTCEPNYDKSSPPITRTVFCFGVFDGHGGSECSNYLKNHLFENIENINISKKAIDDVKKFYKSKINGYWKRWGRRIGDVLVSECKIEVPVRSYIDQINEKYRKSEPQPATIKESGSQDTDHDEGVDISNEEVNLIDWEDFRNGKKLWTVLEMMLKDKKLTHWEIFKIRLWLGYLFTDLQFLTWENDVNSERKMKSKIKESEEVQYRLVNSGSTCTSCFTYAVDWEESDTNHYFYQDNVVSRLVVAHVGDTRAILCDKDGLAHSLTKDHHPSNPIEARRLRKFSAGMIMTDSFGEERFLNFANTRSFGDISAKDIGITSEPEISEYLIGNSRMMKKFKEDPKNAQKLKDNDVLDFGGDESFIVLISDGVTNNLSDQEIVDLIKTNFNNRGVNRGNPSKGAEEVVGFVECIGGDDNATCLVVRLGGWGKWPIEDRTGKLREERMMDTRYNR